MTSSVSILPGDFNRKSGNENEVKRLCEMDAARAAVHLVAYHPTITEVELLFDRTRDELGSSITLEVVQRILSANPDTIHAFAFRDRHDVRSPRADGFIAWLPLTRQGKQALLNGTFAASDPANDHVAGQHDRPAAIYLWALYAPDGLAAGISWAYQRWSTPNYRDADIYARAATPRGLKFMERVGFERLREDESTLAADLYVYRRSQPVVTQPIYDTYPNPHRRHTITVVRSYDDLAKVMAIRAAAFMAEQACPYEEEFDGNDFSSTHLLGFVGGEPAACLRIRCFASFAKVERLVVRAEHRNSRLSFVIVRAAHELCRVKGYTRVYGHAQKRLVDFWRRAGARPFPGAREFKFSDFDYVEMLAEIPAHPTPIAVGTDPYVIIRPEGRWHMTGVLERSANRPTITEADDTTPDRRQA